MNDMRTTLTERGQVSVPASIRRKAGLRQGQSLRWEYLSENEFLVRVESPGSPAGAFAALGYAKRWADRKAIARTDDVLRELREGDDT